MKLFLIDFIIEDLLSYRQGSTYLGVHKHLRGSTVGSFEFCSWKVESKECSSNGDQGERSSCFVFGVCAL